MDFVVNKSLDFLMLNADMTDKILIAKIKYGLYALYSEVSKFLIIFILSILFNCIQEILLIFSLLLIRIFLGGYHCKTYIGCLASTSLSYFFIVFLSNLNINFSLLSQITILLLSMIIIFLVKDPPNPRRNRTKKQRLQNKFIAFYLIVTFILISNFICLSLKNCINFMIIYIILDYLRSVYYENKKSF